MQNRLNKYLRCESNMKWLLITLLLTSLSTLGHAQAQIMSTPALAPANTLIRPSVLHNAEHKMTPPPAIPPPKSNHSQRSGLPMGEHLENQLLRLQNPVPTRRMPAMGTLPTQRNLPIGLSAKSKLYRK
jgi:hypothetical protein